VPIEARAQQMDGLGNLGVRLTPPRRRRSIR
jgi:hypothetical protein